MSVAVTNECGGYDARGGYDFLRGGYECICRLRVHVAVGYEYMWRLRVYVAVTGARGGYDFLRGWHNMATTERA